MLDELRKLPDSIVSADEALIEVRAHTQRRDNLRNKLTRTGYGG